MAASDTPVVRPGGAAPSSQGIVQYLQDVRSELKKAEWPSRAELIRLTEIVLILIAVVALYCGGLDALLSLVTTRLFNKG